MLHSSEPVQVDRRSIASFGHYAMVAPRFAPPIDRAPIHKARVSPSYNTAGTAAAAPQPGAAA